MVVDTRTPTPHEPREQLRARRGAPGRAERGGHLRRPRRSQVGASPPRRSNPSTCSASRSPPRPTTTCWPGCASRGAGAGGWSWSCSPSTTPRAPRPPGPTEPSRGPQRADLGGGRRRLRAQPPGVGGRASRCTSCAPRSGPSGSTPPGRRPGPPPRPPILSRSQWGARAPKEPYTTGARPQAGHRPPLGERQLVQPRRRPGAPARDPGVPHGRAGLERHRLQLRRRPLRSHLGSPGRGRRQPDRRRPLAGLQHVDHRGHGARRLHDRHAPAGVGRRGGRTSSAGSSPATARTCAAPRSSRRWAGRATRAAPWCSSRRSSVTATSARRRARAAGSTAASARSAPRRRRASTPTSPASPSNRSSATSTATACATSCATGRARPPTCSGPVPGGGIRRSTLTVGGTYRPGRGRLRRRRARRHPLVRAGLLTGRPGLVRRRRRVHQPGGRPPRARLPDRGRARRRRPGRRGDLRAGPVARPDLPWPGQPHASTRGRW